MSNQVLHFPFSISNLGKIATVEAYTKDHIENNLLQLITTRKGERIMQPEYGANIDKTVFEEADNEALINMILHELCETISIYEPRIELTTDDITYSVTNNVLTLVLNYTIVSNGSSNSFAIEL